MTTEHSSARFCKVFILTLLLSASTLSAGSIPPFINYQGKLTDAEGAPLPTADYALTFRIFDAATGGTGVWGPQMFDGVTAQGHGAKVPVVQGFFNVILGPVDTSGRSILDAFSGDRYLQIDAGNGPILPRQKILTTAFAANGVPAGSVFAFVGSAPPPGYLICDGSLVSRTVYATLFQAIGVSFGSGDSSTTFNLPDLRGRTAIGAGHSPGLTARKIGEVHGEEAHKLLVGEMPSHVHHVGYAAQFSSGTTGNEITQNSGFAPFGFRDTWPEGGDQAHNIMQPSLVLNYIVKY